MRLQRSPTSGATSAVTPLTPTNTTNPSHLQQQSNKDHTTSSRSPINKQPHMSELVGHYVAHVRHVSSEAGEIERDVSELVAYQEAHQKHAAQQAQMPDGDASSFSHSQSRPGSYATQAYREFLASTSSSASVSGASSAASSAVQSRRESRVSSGYNSQAISGQSSRNTSPMSKREDANGAQRYTYDVQAQVQPSQSSAYIEAAFSGAHVQGTTTTVASVTMSTLSFGNLALNKSDSSSSLEEGEDGGVSHHHPRPRPRAPSHFTFCEQDIMKSFLRAAERDRARAEREERAREVQERLQIEQEYERRKQLQREMQAREMTYQAQAKTVYPPGSVGESLSSSSASPDSPPVRRRDRRRFPPAPAHFKFSSHDVTKSASKPSQRQNIGHWTTFPRSSTIMLPAEQLRAWIRSMVSEQEAERRNKARKQTLAPTSTVEQQVKKLTDSTHGSSTARLPLRGLAAQRRASLPSGYGIDHSKSMVSGHNVPVRAGHVRSSSYGQDRLAKVVPVERATYSQANVDGGRSGVDDAALTSVYATAVRRASLGGDQRTGFERSSSLKPVKGVPMITTIVQSTNVAMDATRRTTTLQLRHARPASSSSDMTNMNGSTASAPSSTSQSPNRSASTLVNGRLVRSNHVSPTRSDQRRLIQSATVIANAQHRQAQASVGRKASIGGVESKNSSANNSPNMPLRGLHGSTSETAIDYEVAYENTMKDLSHINLGQAHYSYHVSGNGYQKPLSLLYKDVPSSGYGQRVRSSN